MSEKESQKVNKYYQEMSGRRGILKKSAQEIGLKQYLTPTSTVWTAEEYNSGELPYHFYVEMYLEDEEPKLKEYKINFPVENFEQFIENLEAVEAFYVNTEDMLKEDRDGRKLLDFLKDFRKKMHNSLKASNRFEQVIKTRDYTQQDVEEFIKDDELDEEARRIKENFEKRMEKDNQ